jgi:hypothetical protein
MLSAVQLVATLCCTLFAGAALYITLVEHPARMSGDTKTAAMMWAPSYKRATLMQAPLAVVSFLAGIAVWLMGESIPWLVAAILIGSVVPFTLTVIMQTNRKLLAAGRDLGSRETRDLLETWGRQHAVRTGLSVLASLIYVALLAWA